MARIPFVRLFRVFKTIAIGLWALSGFAFVLCFLLYWLYGGLLAFILLIIVILGILYKAEDNLMYHPELPTHARVFVPIPTMFGLPYENLYIRSQDGTLLHLFFIKQPDDRRLQCSTILFLHGNAGNIGHRLSNVQGLYQHLRCNILLLEYRGYGLSEGVPNEEGLYTDARSAFDYLISRNDINKSEIIVFGRSLGGAVAMDLACRPEYADKMWCIILENTFTSIPEMVKVFVHWKCIHYLPLCFYKNKFLSVNKIQMLRVPALFMSGLADALVPARMMNELHAKCGSEIKQIVHVPNGTHDDTWTMPGYYKHIILFLQSNTERKRIVSPSTQTSTWKNIQNI